MITELFYSHILNMDRGSLRAKRFRRIQLSVFRHRLVVLRTRKVPRVFEKRAPAQVITWRMKHPACYAARRVSIPISLCDHYLQAHGFVRYLGRFCVVERRDFVLFKRGIFLLFVSLFAALASKRRFTSF